MYEIYIPKSYELKKHIYNFCVLSPFSDKINYLAFPQLGTSIGLYSHSDIKTEGRSLMISKTKKQNIQILVLGKYKLPLHVVYSEYTPEISINFTATGLNYFFKENTNNLAKDRIQFLKNDNWAFIAEIIFKQCSNHKKMEYLESFLIENLIEKDLSKIEYSISNITRNPEINISQIAKKLSITTRTLNRWFAEYIGCSPTDFKKIYRFRKAIKIKINNPIKNLTQVCFESSFYDSPHFTREFKKLTNLSPRDFFLSIDTVTETKIPYKFL